MRSIATCARIERHWAAATLLLCEILSLLSIVSEPERNSVAILLAISPHSVHIWWASESIWPGECHSIVVSRPIVRDLFTTFLEQWSAAHARTLKFGVARQYIASTKFVQLCDRQINLFSRELAFFVVVGSSVRARAIFKLRRQLALALGADKQKPALE